MLNPGPRLSALLRLEALLPWRLADNLATRNDQALRQKYREWLARTAAVPVNADNPIAEVHQLLGHRHVGMGLWSLKSLVASADAGLGVVIHDDGSLTEADTALMQEHLPGVRIIRRAAADAAVRQKLAGYPACQSFRFGEVMVTNHRGQSYNMFIMSLILFDMSLLTDCDKIIILDADVLFFRRPDIISQWSLDAADRRTLYSVEAFKPERQADGSLSFGAKAARTLNSGLLCYSKTALYDLDEIESWVGGNPDLMYTSPVFEQLCYSWLAKRRKDSVELDPELYGFNYTTPESIATHFGIKRGFFENLHRAAAVLTSEQRT
jgi:hypothetical protein